MKLGEFATWAAIGISALIGVVGWITAGIANSRAKTANTIADKAVAAAAAANEIAEHANALSDEANALVSRSIAQQQEDWFVDWDATWDHKTDTVTLLNKGRDQARSVTVVAKTDGIHRVFNQLGDVDAGKSIPLSLEEIAELRRTRTDANNRTREMTLSLGTIYISMPFEAKLYLHVRWRTGAGVPGTHDADLSVN